MRRTLFVLCSTLPDAEWRCALGRGGRGEASRASRRTSSCTDYRAPPPSQILIRRQQVLERDKFRRSSRNSQYPPPSHSSPSSPPPHMMSNIYCPRTLALRPSGRLTDPLRLSGNEVVPASVVRLVVMRTTFNPDLSTRRPPPSAQHKAASECTGTDVSLVDPVDPGILPHRNRNVLDEVSHPSLLLLLLLGPPRSLARYDATTSQTCTDPCPRYGAGRGEGQNDLPFFR